MACTLFLFVLVFSSAESRNADWVLATLTEEYDSLSSSKVPHPLRPRYPIPCRQCGDEQSESKL